MLRLSKKVEYAIIAMLYMANKPVGELVTTRELAENFNIPSELMGKVLQILAKNRLIESNQGVKGGYRLNKPLEKITITKVVNIIDGPIHLVNCMEAKDICECEQLDFCNIKKPMEVVHLKLVKFFDTISLKDLRMFPPHFTPLNIIQVE